MSIKQNSTTFLLEQTMEKGYIQPALLPSYIQKINHSLAKFFKKTPVSAQQAESCMELLKGIADSNFSFFSLFQETMFDLHDWAVTGDELTKTRADNQLLRFFSREAPSTIKRKNTLLTKIQNMGRLNEKESALAEVLHRLTDHYDQNHQINEDPGKSVLHNSKKILDLIPKTRKTSAFCKSRFLACTVIIKKLAPELVGENYDNRFSFSKKKKNCVPTILEPTTICSRIPYRKTGDHFSRGW